MKHIHIINLILSIAAYVFAFLFANGYSDTWGYIQWTVLAIVAPALTLTAAFSWKVISK